RERKHRVNDRANAAGVDESRDLNELGAVRLHQHGNTANAVFRSDRFRSVAAIVTRTPPGRNTPQDRSRVSPPTVSMTASTRRRDGGWGAKSAAGAATSSAAAPSRQKFNRP